MLTNIPQWQQEILNFKGVKSMFVLEKNIADIYPTWARSTPSPSVDEIDFVSMRDLLAALFQKNSSTQHYRMVFYDPISHFSNPYNDPTLSELIQSADQEAQETIAQEEAINAYRHQDSQEQRYVRDSHIIKALMTRNCRVNDMSNTPICIVIGMASRLVASVDALMPDDVTLFSNYLISAENALSPDRQNRNTLVFVTDNLRDLPEWLISSNPNMRPIVVPKPDRETRACYVEAFFDCGESIPKEGKSEIEEFIDKTDGMTLRELDELRRMHVRSGEGIGGLSRLVDTYKYGMKENKWASIAHKLGNNPSEAIRRRVKGQERAVSAVVSVLKRSALGLSGSTHSGSRKPKGILFLAGPTGTGKTEMVKSVTELLFGDERSMLRFDMSEYRGDNSDQRLFGAPPGYVGYSQGGQLTNAVRANPFSVLLFDEIEKANSSVMDKFLQILEDGRMTDGQGNTVYFSETIIFFTSNVGFSEEVYDPTGHSVIERKTLISPREPYEDVRSKVLSAMEAKFKPEFLGRIGNNIVVFDFIDDDSAAAILEQKIARINCFVESQHSISIVVDTSCYEMLLESALSDRVREKGGRGIGNLVESEYLNPLSDYLFDHNVRPGSDIRVLSNGQSITFEEGRT